MASARANLRTAVGHRPGVSPAIDADGRRRQATRTSLLLLAIAFAATSPRCAHAERVRICVAVDGAFDPPEAWARLVTDEVRRHRSHTPASADCETTLHVELIVAKAERWLTAYLDGQVPQRTRLKPGDSLEQALSATVTTVLGSDALTLSQDTGRFLDALSHTPTSARRGVMLYGLEVFQNIIRGVDGADFLPGFGLRIRRGIGAFHVGARATASLFPARRGADGPRPELWVNLEAESAWFVSPAARTSFYLGASAGVAVARYVVPVERPRASPTDPPDPDKRETVVDWGFTLGARAGVEFFRASDFRLDLFVAGVLPLFATHDSARALIDLYTPSAHLGVGVAF